LPKSNSKEKKKQF